MTGGMTTSRDFHTATLLPNGQVLVAGGYNFTGGDLSSAELFNPVTGIWTPTGALHTARYSHTATLLPSGKVLVAGGYNGPNPSTSAELYDPASRTWTATGAMQNGRFNHTATLLFNGKVLVAGGANFTGAYPSLFATLADSELFRSHYRDLDGDRSDDHSTPVSHRRLYCPMARCLSSGGTSDVYIGSEPDRYNSLSSAELYDPSHGNMDGNRPYDDRALSKTRQLYCPIGRSWSQGALTAAVSFPVRKCKIQPSGLGWRQQTR